MELKEWTSIQKRSENVRRLQIPFRDDKKPYYPHSCVGLFMVSMDFMAPHRTLFETHMSKGHGKDHDEISEGH